MEKLIKRIPLLCGLFLGALVFLVPSKAYAGDGYYIEDYQVDATYHEDNTIDITESIEVNFEEEKHGIYRAIPDYFYVKRDVSQEGDGSFYETKKYDTSIENLNVEGYEWDYADDSDMDGTVIQIGDEDVTLTGYHTYVITYTLVIPDDRITNSDFIFYSILGDQWQTEINHFSFDVTFDKALSEEAQQNFTIYSGSYGGETNALNVEYTVTANEVTGQVDNVGAYEAVTLFTDMENGYFVGAKEITSTAMYFFLILGIIVGILLLIKGFVGRSEKPVVTVEFYPPNNLSPAEVGTVIDEVADDIDIMSLIPYLAHKGYLTIEEVKGTFGKVHLKLDKTGKALKQEKRHVSVFYNALFPHGINSIELNDLPESFGEDFTTARELVQDEFKGDKKLSTGGIAGFVIYILEAIFVAIGIGVSSKVGPEENLICGIMFLIPAGILGYLRMKQSYKDHLRAKSKWIGIVLLDALLVIFELFAMDLALSDDSFTSSMEWIAILVLFLGAVTMGMQHKETQYKIEMTGKLLGLKQFIETAELDRLKMLVDENPEYFYDILPYAMVFDLTDKWAKAFKDIPTTPPSWYVCSGNNLFNYWYFNHIMNTCMKAPITQFRTEAAVKATASSVMSSGGGFSGGGAGGGGGGAW